MDIDDTIAAVASASGGAARGIVRVCGRAAVDCVRATFRPDADDAAWNVTAATAVAGTLTLPEFRSPVAADAFVWPDDRSYARQPTVELHLPGSPPLIAAALTAVCRAGARLARPGEFTLRAFLAGRIDLTRAEAVLGVVDAVDRRGLDTALRQLAGGLATPLDALRNDLLNLLADLEAGLDFVEEDIEFIRRDDLVRRLTTAHETVERLLSRMAGRAEAGELPRVVLTGPPNVGKSSLFNALVGQGRALVSAVAGTTRDYLTARVECGGIEVELIDTAGLDEAPNDMVAAASQRQSNEQQSRADLRLACLDASHDAPSEAPLPDSADTLHVRTKCDLVTSRPPAVRYRVSAVTGDGIGELKQAIAVRITDRQAERGEYTPHTAVRCRDSLHQAEEALSRARLLAVRRAGDELVAAEIRATLDELGQVVGAVYTDDILDRIFSRFCIGK